MTTSNKIVFKCHESMIHSLHLKSNNVFMENLGIRENNFWDF